MLSTPDKCINIYMQQALAIRLDKLQNSQSCIPLYTIFFFKLTITLNKQLLIITIHWAGYGWELVQDVVPCVHTFDCAFWYTHVHLLYSFYCPFLLLIIVTQCCRCLKRLLCYNVSPYQKGMCNTIVERKPLIQSLY